MSGKVEIYSIHTNKGWAHKIAILNCGEVVRALDLAKNIYKNALKVETELCGRKVEIEVEDSSSRKHTRKYAWLPQDLVKAVIEVEEYIGGAKEVKMVEGEGEIKARIEEVTQEDEKYIIKKKYQVYYWTDGKETIEIAKEYIEGKKELKGLPEIQAKLIKAPQGSLLIVKGDTYPVKGELKRLGFRWNGLDRYWELKNADEKDIEKLKEALEGKAKIEVEIKDFTG